MDEQKKLEKFLKNNIHTIKQSIFISAKDKRRIKNYLKYHAGSLPFKIKNYCIQIFKEKKLSFDKDTPLFILSDIDCCKIAIDSDIRSIHYISFDSNDELMDYVIKSCIDKKYILNDNSPDFLFKVYEVCVNSIMHNLSISNYILWNNLDKDDALKLIDLLIQRGYVLDRFSPEYLRCNVKIVLSSIQKNINSFQYANNSLLQNYEIVSYLLDNNYPFKKEELSWVPLSFLKNEKNISKVFQNITADKYFDDLLFKNEFNKFVYNFLHNNPLISDFKEYFEYFFEQEWHNNRNNNPLLLDNIFGIICAELKNSDSFDKALDKFIFLKKMQEILKDDYFKLYNAMENYYVIAHSNEKNKVKKLELYSDLISYLSNLYIMMSKEQLKKEIKDDYYEFIRPFFIIKKDHPEVLKKTVLQRKKILFRELYENNDPKINCFIGKLEKKYTKEIDKDLFYKLVNGFLLNNFKKVDDYYYLMPVAYPRYIRYLEAKKLINRLNSGYIKYHDKEVLLYRDIIKYDDEIGKYYYNGLLFKDEDILKFKEYERLSYIFKKLKQDIFMEIKNLPSVEINSKVYDELKKDFSFSDEYFVFDKESLNNIKVYDLFYMLTLSNIKKYLNNHSFNLYYNLLINKKALWFLLMNDNCNNIDDKLWLQVINNIDNINNFSKGFNYDLTKIKDLFDLYYIYQNCDNISLSILGKDIVKLLDNKGYDTYGTCLNDKVLVAKELVCEMIKKNKSTIPYVEGKTTNYRYKTYDSGDVDLLVSGILTDSCFRVLGNDNDFLHYVSLSKNGYAIKIMDSYGNFIGRAAGFRNGNCLFFNQLRTIYDEGGNTYIGKYNSQKKEIIEVFQKACLDILNASQNNKLEKDKIEHIFINQSYIFDNYGKVIPKKVFDLIDMYPMDNGSDFRSFLKNTKNLQNPDLGYFETDYGAYDVICMASIKKTNELLPSDIRFMDIDAVYKRTRNKVIMSKEINQDLKNKIERIRAIKCYYDKTSYSPMIVENNSLVFMGDNWFIVLDNGIINSCLLDFDLDAKKEFDIVMNYINDNINNINVLQEIDIDVKIKILIK